MSKQPEPDQMDQTIAMDVDVETILYRPEGVFRVKRGPSGRGLVFTRASELSLRYPIIHIDLTRRQAS